MGISLSTETKSKVSLSNDAKSSSLKWNLAEWIWDSATSKWSNPAITLLKETKSKISLSNESK